MILLAAVADGSPANPFARDTEGSSRNIAAYKVLTVLSWLLQFVTTIYLSVGHGHRGWFGKHAGHPHATPFTLNTIFVEIFWVALYIMQIVYVWHLFSECPSNENAAEGFNANENQASVMTL